METLFWTGAALTAAAGAYFFVTIRARRRRRALALARLHRLTDWHGWPDEAGYYPGSSVDPRD
jgi:hypothetical protein